MQKHSTLKPAYRADIDGLRAIAVLGVIIWHAGLSAQGRPLLPGGFLGVDVFFVISGFLMTRIWAGGISVSDFAKRRARRILPMLFATILICIPFALWLMSRSAQSEFASDALASAGLVPNIAFSFQDSYWSAPAKVRPLLHLWTIGVEMQFYLLCPLIFLGLKKGGRPILGLSLISGLSFAAAVWLSRTHPDIAFYNMPTRLWEFSLGALVFYLPTTKLNKFTLSFLGLGLIIASFLLLKETMNHPAGLTLLPVIGSCLVVAGGRGFRNTVLTFPLLRRIGIISFSAYLIHQPLFAFTRISMGQTDLPLILSLGLIILTFALSELTYRLIETPLRKSGIPRAFIIAMLGLVVLIGASALLTTIRTNIDSEALLIKPDRWILNASETRCVNKEVAHPCRLGNSDIRPTIALLGDSHMQAMSGGFDEFFAAQRLNDIDYSMGGCPFIMGVRRYARKYSCDAFAEEVFRDLRRREIKTVIILDRRNAYLLGKGAVFNDGREEPADVRLYPVAIGPDAPAAEREAEAARLHLATIQRLRDMDIRVVLILPIPEIGIHVPDALAERVTSGDLPLTLDRNLHDARQTPLAALRAMADKDEGILQIDPADIFCDDQRCFTHRDTDVFYTDRDHLSRAGTELVLAEAGAAILEFVNAAPLEK